LLIAITPAGARCAAQANSAKGSGGVDRADQGDARPDRARKARGSRHRKGQQHQRAERQADLAQRQGAELRRGNALEQEGRAPDRTEHAEFDGVEQRACLATGVARGGRTMSAARFMAQTRCVSAAIFRPHPIAHKRILWRPGTNRFEARTMAPAP
jgi:hypothetical protein